MLGFDRRAAKVAWTVALIGLGLLTLYAVRNTIFVLVLALFFAYMVYPLVVRITALAPRRLSRPIATGLVFCMLLLAVAVMVGLVGPPIAEQASALSQEIPKLANGAKILDNVPLPDWLASYRGRLIQFVNDNLQSGTAYAMPIAKRIGAGALAVAGNLIYVVLIPILAFLLIKDGSTMRDAFLDWTRRGEHAEMWRRIVGDLDTLLGGYMRALLILSLATIVVYSIVFSLAGVPFGLLLAVLAGVLEFIPVLGPLIAALVCGVVAAVSGYDHVLAILGFIALYRLFQDYVLNPYLMSEGVTVPPLLVLLGLVAGEEIGGVAGVFLSVPVLAVAKILARRISHEWRVGPAADVAPPAAALPDAADKAAAAAAAAATP
ncbi:MAG: AI-2E family transporter [Pseudomonadota bacterium]|nr:AI-2E family transporter [Pseudomonadota bacterium]